MSKLSNSTAITTFSGDETFVLLDDDDGTVLNAKMTVENVAAGLAERTEFTGTYVAMVAASSTVTVGAGGDYATISAALVALSKKKALYVNGGFTATISLLTGFVMAEQIAIENVDLGWVEITSVDAEVTVTRSAIPSGQGAWYAIRNAVLPRINCFFRMDATGVGTGYRVFDIFRGSRIEFVGPAAGGGGNVNRVLNLNHGSLCVATAGCKLVDSLDIGARVANGSTMTAPASVITNNTNNGVNVSSGSVVDVANSTITGSVTNVVITGGGIVVCSAADLTGAGAGVAISADSGWVYAYGANVTGGGITAGSNTSIDARTCTMDAGDPITVADGGRIDVEGRTGGTLSQTANLHTRNGVIYDSAAADQPLAIKMKTGGSRYYGAPYSGAVSSAAKTQATVYYTPLVVPNDCTINRLSVVVVTTPGSVGSVYRLGLYASDTSGEPGALVVDGGTADTTVTGERFVTINQALKPGLYWMAACPQGAPATAAVVYVMTLGAMLNLPIAAASNLEPRGFTQTGVTGALPANATPVVNDAATTPRVLVRIA